MSIKLSIIVPCYNEKKNIPLLLDRFNKVIQKRDVEIILVDNGSFDGSKEILVKILPMYKFARSIRVEKNRGYGYGILQGLKAAEGDFLGWTHADIQTAYQDIIQALDIIEANNSRANVFIKGYRHGRSMLDSFFTLGMSVFETIFLGRILYEINAQPNIFSRKFFSTWEKPPYDFSLDLYALYMANKQGLDIHRFSVDCPKRIYGISTWNTGISARWIFIKSTLKFSLKLKFGGIK